MNLDDKLKAINIKTSHGTVRLDDHEISLIKEAFRSEGWYERTPVDHSDDPLFQPVKDKKK